MKRGEGGGGLGALALHSKPSFQTASYLHLTRRGGVVEERWMRLVPTSLESPLSHALPPPLPLPSSSHLQLCFAQQLGQLTNMPEDLGLKP